jgi:hypothetical protein
MYSAKRDLIQEKIETAREENIGQLKERVQAISGVTSTPTHATTLRRNRASY